MNIWLVDAFSDKPFHGNPAAVMIVPEFFDDALSIKIAAELNLVETAFVKILENNHCHVRWFAPDREVTMCGHATLAAAHILWEEHLIQGNHIAFNSLSGVLNVQRSAEGLTLDFPLQMTGPPLDSHRFASIFNTNPVNAVRANDDIIVELSSEERVRNLKFDHNKLLEFDCRAVIVTSKGDHTYDFISRLFAPRIGIQEDAVSGAAHCKLADYWQKKLGKSKFLAYQASARGGEILVEIVKDRVHLTGKALTTMKGEWLAQIVNLPYSGIVKN